MQRLLGILVLLLSASVPRSSAAAAEPTVDFNRDIRPILSNRCFRCHGPDAKQRKSDLRLDQRSVAVDDLGVIVPGDPESSELLARIVSTGKDRMPPKSSGIELTPAEIKTLQLWVKQGAPYAGHWSYQPPLRPALPTLKETAWVRNPIDFFVLKRLAAEKLKPTATADHYTLARRLALDLTGLPPTLEQLETFVADKSPAAYENLIDSLLKSPRYGERWAVMWLDLARYADSAGYADDPPRTIWLYRDWVIRALNDNMPFDQFTVEQIAGDLLPEPSPDQLTATAFHRNTLTNSEGGTDDEEFRNVAIVDRVNTTLQVWMGTTIRCAQCHDHKYDPISQEEFFKFFAFFNNSQDADRRNEDPLLTVLPESMKEQKAQLEANMLALRGQLAPSPTTLATQHQAWARLAGRDYGWKPLFPTKLSASSGATLAVGSEAAITATGASASTDTYVLDFETDLVGITGLQLEALPAPDLPKQGPGRSSGGNFVLSEIRVVDHSKSNQPRQGRYVRLELPGKGKMIHVAEVQVFSGGNNIAPAGKATQSSTGFGGPAERAIDGNTDGKYANNSVTHTAVSTDPWLEVDLGGLKPVDRIAIWNRTDANLQSRLNGFVLSLLDDERQLVWKETYAAAPKKELTADLTGSSTAIFADASADVEQAGDGKTAPADGWLARYAIDGDEKTKRAGWAVGGNIGATSRAAFRFQEPLGVSGQPTKFQITLSQQYGENHTLGRFRISATTADGLVRLLPATLGALVSRSHDKLTAAEKQIFLDYYNRLVPPPKKVTDQLAALQKKIDSVKGVTVPIMRELAADKRRKTHIQIRGNFLAKEGEVSEGVPAVFHSLPPNAPVNRLGVAQWLVSRDNPLTARVVVNRYWERLFGRGLVVTSEDFGTQGALPTHPELLDWLAVDLMENGWDIKSLLKTIVMSATYRQSSAIVGNAVSIDPDNHLLARGPRFRLSAEMIRDQALSVSGLLSSKMYGPSVRPPRPNLGLKAAFGGSTDWATSPGEDKYRRGLYTSWRRSIPYPSMAVFDAPTRNVCTIRRVQTNTPLQALVTLNDPVYVEAAQRFARRVISHSASDLSTQINFAFRLCLSRPPGPAETARLKLLHTQLHLRYDTDQELATQMATSLAGPAPKDVSLPELATWTVICNVLLNLDEALTKR
jgi:hypothetical protein